MGTAYEVLFATLGLSLTRLAEEFFFQRVKLLLGSALRT